MTDGDFDAIGPCTCETEPRGGHLLCNNCRLRLAKIAEILAEENVGPLRIETLTILPPQPDQRN